MSATATQQRVIRDGFQVQVKTETWRDGSQIVTVWHDTQPLRSVSVHFDPDHSDPGRQVQVSWPSGNVAPAHAMAFGAVLAEANHRAYELFRARVMHRSEV